MKRHDIICAALGIIFGGCIGVLGTRQYFDLKYKTLAEEMIEEHKAYMEKKYAGYIEAKEEETVEPEAATRGFTEEEKKAISDLHVYRQIINSYSGKAVEGEHVGRRDYTKPALDEIAKKYAEDPESALAESEQPEEEEDVPPDHFEMGEEYESEVAQRIESGAARSYPYEISEEEYNDPLLDAVFAKEELRWFEDGEIVDERDEPCQEAYKYLGDTLEDGVINDNWDVRFVRNEKLIMDFMISNMHQSYEDFLINKYGDASWRDD